MVASRRWSDQLSHIVLGEGRAIVYTAVHILRSADSFRRRHLLLSDSLVNVLALSNGRSSARHVWPTARSLAALTLASGAAFHLRWVPTDTNPADGPSRGLTYAAVCDGGAAQPRGEEAALAAASAAPTDDAFSCSDAGGGLEEVTAEHRQAQPSCPADGDRRASGSATGTMATVREAAAACGTGSRPLLLRLRRAARRRQTVASSAVVPGLTFLE